MSPFQWPTADFLEALIECGLIDRSNPRPCTLCKNRMIYGNRHKQYCGPCRTIMGRKQRAAAKRTGSCLDCSATINRPAKRCVACSYRYHQALRKNAA